MRKDSRSAAIRATTDISTIPTRISGCTSARTVFRCADVEKILRAFYTAGDDSVWKRIWEMYALVRWLETTDRKDADV